jgi:hypothetical protein
LKLETAIKTHFVPHDMDCNSCHYKFLLNSLPLGLLKPETSISQTSIQAETPFFRIIKPAVPGEPGGILIILKNVLKYENMQK